MTFIVILKNVPVQNATSELFKILLSISMFKALLC